MGAGRRGREPRDLGSVEGTTPHRRFRAGGPGRHRHLSVGPEEQTGQQTRPGHASSASRRHHGEVRPRPKLAVSTATDDSPRGADTDRWIQSCDHADGEQDVVAGLTTQCPNPRPQHASTCTQSCRLSRKSTGRAAAGPQEVARIAALLVPSVRFELPRRGRRRRRRRARSSMPASTGALHRSATGLDRREPTRCPSAVNLVTRGAGARAHACGAQLGDERGGSGDSPGEIERHPDQPTILITPADGGQVGDMSFPLVPGPFVQASIVEPVPMHVRISACPVTMSCWARSSTAVVSASRHEPSTHPASICWSASWSCRLMVHP